MPLFGDEGLQLAEAKVPPFVVPAGKAAFPFLSSLIRGVGHADGERIAEMHTVCPVRCGLSFPVEGRESEGAIAALEVFEPYSFFPVSLA